MLASWQNVTDRYGSVGLARTANDARIEGDGSRLRNLRDRHQRTMLRIKALYRGRGIATTGSGVYQAKHREQWLEQLTEVGTQQRAAWLYEQLDHSLTSAEQAKAAVLAGRPTTTERSSCCERFPKWDRSGQRKSSPPPALRIDSERSDSCGVTAVWRL